MTRATAPSPAATSWTRSRADGGTRANKKHKGNHGKRAELRAERRATEKQQASLRNPASADKPRRVYLRNGVYIWGTLGVIVGVVAILILFDRLGLWDNVIGSVLSVLVGAFGCMCLYDLALLMTACTSPTARI